MFVCSNCNDNLLTCHACNRGKGVMKVGAFALDEALGYQTGFVSGDLSIVSLLDAKDPFTPYSLFAFGKLCQLENLELGEGCHFIIHGLESLNVL